MSERNWRQNLKVSHIISNHEPLSHAPYFSMKNSAQCSKLKSNLRNNLKYFSKNQLESTIEKSKPKHKNNLANKHANRIFQKRKNFKKTIAERIASEQARLDTEIIEQFPEYNSLEKEEKINNFLKRQSFKARQIQMLRKMVEYYQYGNVKQ